MIVAKKLKQAHGMTFSEFLGPRGLSRDMADLRDFRLQSDTQGHKPN